MTRCGRSGMDAVVADAELLFVFPARFFDALLEGMAQVAAEGLAIGPDGEDSDYGPIGTTNFLCSISLV